MELIDVIAEMHVKVDLPAVPLEAGYGQDIIGCSVGGRDILCWKLRIAICENDNLGVLVV